MTKVDTVGKYLSIILVTSLINVHFNIIIFKTPNSEVGIHERSARKKIFINAKDRKLILSFAKSMINKPETYRNNVLFADESKFNIFGFDGRITVGRKKK